MASVQLETCRTKSGIQTSKVLWEILEVDDQETTLDLRIMNCSTHWMDIYNAMIIYDMLWIAPWQTWSMHSIRPAGASHATYRHQTHEMHKYHLPQPTKWRFLQSLEEQRTIQTCTLVARYKTNQTPSFSGKRPPASKSHQMALVSEAQEAPKFLFEESREQTKSVWIHRTSNLTILTSCN